MVELQRTKQILEMMFSITSKRKDSKQHEMIQTCINHRDEWPVDKLNRWIGYAQALCVVSGAINLEDLIDKTREVVKDI